MLLLIKKVNNDTRSDIYYFLTIAKKKNIKTKVMMDAAPISRIGDDAKSG